MKNVLHLELFGEDTRYLMNSWTKMIDDIEPGLGTATIGTMPASSWVAEIIGLHPKYKLERKFLKCNKDYSQSNSKGSRGIFAEYVLESGKVYDVKEQSTWKNSKRYYCTVCDDGEIKKMTEEEVIEQAVNKWVKST